MCARAAVHYILTTGLYIIHKKVVYTYTKWTNSCICSNSSHTQKHTHTNRVEPQKLGTLFRPIASQRSAVSSHSFPPLSHPPTCFPHLNSKRNVVPTPSQRLESVNFDCGSSKLVRSSFPFPLSACPPPLAHVWQ